jgi:hypothetical protein
VWIEYANEKFGYNDRKYPSCELQTFSNCVIHRGDELLSKSESYLKSEGISTIDLEILLLEYSHYLDEIYDATFFLISAGPWSEYIEKVEVLEDEKIGIHNTMRFIRKVSDNKYFLLDKRLVIKSVMMAIRDLQVQLSYQVLINGPKQGCTFFSLPPKPFIQLKSSKSSADSIEVVVGAGRPMYDFDKMRIFYDNKEYDFTQPLILTSYKDIFLQAYWVNDSIQLKSFQSNLYPAIISNNVNVYQ